MHIPLAQKIVVESEENAKNKYRDIAVHCRKYKLQMDPHGQLMHHHVNLSHIHIICKGKRASKDESRASSSGARYVSSNVQAYRVRATNVMRISSKADVQAPGVPTNYRTVCSSTILI